MDQRWDLALLVIRDPGNIVPIALSQQIPQLGDTLTIAGYGSDHFRAARGRCMQFVSPEPAAPYEMIEVNVSARQGDSGGPILNERGELAAVLFGTGQGMTTGSHIGRVRMFLQEARAEAERAQQLASSAPLSPNPELPATIAPTPSPTATKPLDIPLPFTNPPHAPPPAPVGPPAAENVARIDRSEAAEQLQSLETDAPLHTNMRMVPVIRPDEPPTEVAQNPVASTPTPTVSPHPSAETDPTPEPNSAPAEPNFADTPTPDFDVEEETSNEADGATIAQTQPDEEPAFEESSPAPVPDFAAATAPVRGEPQFTEPAFAPVAAVPQLATRTPLSSPAWQAAPYPSRGQAGAVGPANMEPYGTTGPSEMITWSDLAGPTTWDKIKSAFAIAGVIAVGYVLLHFKAS
jgi:hypothetical protein